VGVLLKKGAQNPGRHFCGRCVALLLPGVAGGLAGQPFFVKSLLNLDAFFSYTH